MPDDLQVRGRDLEDLGGHIADLAQYPTAVRATAQSPVLFPFTWQIMGQRTADGLLAFAILLGGLGFAVRVSCWWGRYCGSAPIDGQIQLVEGPFKSLRGLPELQVPRSSNLQPLDLKALGLQRYLLLDDELCGSVGIFRKVTRLHHASNIRDVHRAHSPLALDCTAFSHFFIRRTESCGRVLLTGLRQSIPSSNIESCAEDKDTTPGGRTIGLAAVRRRSPLARCGLPICRLHCGSFAIC